MRFEIDLSQGCVFDLLCFGRNYFKSMNQNRKSSDYEPSSAAGILSAKSMTSQGRTIIRVLSLSSIALVQFHLFCCQQTDRKVDALRDRAVESARPVRVDLVIVVCDEQLGWLRSFAYVGCMILPILLASPMIDCIPSDGF